MASSFASLAILLSLPVLGRWLPFGLRLADSTTMRIRCPLHRKFHDYRLEMNIEVFTDSLQKVAELYGSASIARNPNVLTDQSRASSWVGST